MSVKAHKVQLSLKKRVIIWCTREREMLIKENKFSGSESKRDWRDKITKAYGALIPTSNS